MPIFDQGYQHWSGELSGHTWRWLAIARHGVRSGMKSRVLSITMKVAWMPALTLAALLCFWGLMEQKSAAIQPIVKLLGFLSPRILSEPKAYRVEIWTILYHHFLLVELYFSMVLILMVGPNLISQDLRYNALPLYFSRPLRRIDYFLGKLGVIAWFLGMVVIVPSIIAYVLGLLFSLDITIVRDTFHLLLASLLYGVIITVSAGLLILAMSSLSRSSRYVGLFWLGLWLIGSVLGTILVSVDQESQRHRAYRREMQSIRAEPTTRMTTQQQRELSRRFQEAYRKANTEWRAAAIEASKRDWRPMVSFTANLSRIGRKLLGTDDAWRSLAKLFPFSERDEFLFAVTGPQYPWRWSAYVLVGIFGLSLCILNFRVKSLDRLK